MDKLPSGRPTIMLLSAPHNERIRRQASTLANWLQQQPDELDMDSVAWTLAVKRSQHRQRSAVVAESKARAMELLSALVRGGGTHTLLLPGRPIRKSPTAPSGSSVATVPSGKAWAARYWRRTGRLPILSSSSSTSSRMKWASL
jgi:6-methylsalicylic acid synthase